MRAVLKGAKLTTLTIYLMDIAMSVQCPAPSSVPVIPHFFNQKGNRTFQHSRLSAEIGKGLAEIRGSDILSEGFFHLEHEFSLLFPFFEIV